MTCYELNYLIEFGKHGLEGINNVPDISSRRRYKRASIKMGGKFIKKAEKF